MAAPIEQLIRHELHTAAELLMQFMSAKENIEGIRQAAEQMAYALKQGNKILACGNGGSYCDALHFVEELTGRYRSDRPALPAIILGDAAHLTCVANDYGFEYVFARAVEALGSKGDVLVAISTSGQSENILRAAEKARQKGIYVIALTGKDGGRLAKLAHLPIVVPYTGYADRIQEVHIKIIHVWILLLEKLMGYSPSIEEQLN